MGLTETGGFEPPRTVLNLAFEAADLAGLAVRMYVPPLGELTRLVELAAGLAPALAAGQATLDQGREALGVYDILTKYIKDWNVTVDGAPVPATPEGLAGLEVGFLNRIVQAWQSAIGEVPAPLAPSSPSTPPPDLSSIPMAPLPASPSS